eukprot:5491171-Amphidinium_carterae.2
MVLRQRVDHLDGVPLTPQAGCYHGDFSDKLIAKRTQWCARILDLGGAGLSVQVGMAVALDPTQLPGWMT